MPSLLLSRYSPRSLTSLLIRYDLALAITWCLIVLSGCDGMNGCQGPTEPFPNKDKVQSAIQVRVTESGLETIGDVVTPIIKEALPPELNSCLPGDSGTSSFVEWRYCNMQTCANGDVGCNINIGVGEVVVSAEDPSTVRASVILDDLSLRFDVAADPIVDCDIAIEGPGVPVNLDLILSTPEPQRNLSLIVSDASYELTDITIRLEGNDGFLSPLCEVLDGAFNLPVLRDLVLGFLSSAIDGILVVALQGVINDFICLPCEGEEDPVCTSQGGSCFLGSCIREDLTCVTRPLGLEGETDLGALLDSVTPGLNAPLSYFVNPGSYAEVEEGGLSLGVITGAGAELNRCVPPAPLPVTEEPPRATALRSNVAPDGQEYDFGLGISQTTIDQFLWSVYTSGATCLGITSATVAQLNSSTLQILLPTLGELTRGPAPIAITIAPQMPPEAVIGANRLSAPNADGERELEEPLITVNWPDLWLDFHAFMEGRWTRLFSLKANIILPLGVTFSPDGGIIPLLGDLNAALTEIEIANDQILLDDTTRISTLLPALTGPLIGVALSSLSEPIALPDVLGFSLAPRDGSVRGISEGDEDFIAVFADLAVTMDLEDMMEAGDVEDAEMSVDMEGQGQRTRFSTDRRSSERALPTHTLSQDVRSAYVHINTSRPLEAHEPLPRHDDTVLETRAHLKQIHAPPVSSWIHAPHQPELYPTVSLNLEASMAGLNEAPDDFHAEFSWQVDGQGWHPFSAAREIVIRDPAFMLPGDHLIEVRARIPDDIFSLDPTPVALSVSLYDLPASRDFDETEPRGLIGRADPALTSAESDSGCACAQRVPDHQRGAHTLGWALLISLFVLIRPRYWSALQTRLSRRRWSALFGLFLMISLGVGGCHDETKSPRVDPREGCNADLCGENQICVDGACATVSCQEDELVCEQLECGDEGAECNADGICQCISAPLCPEGCGANEYCCYLNNACEIPPEPCSALTESLDCDDGFEPGAVVRGEVNPERCMIEGEMCECVESTPLEIQSIGRFSDLAYDTVREVAWVSAYVDDFGDLAIGRVDSEGGISWSWIDGVPADAPVAAGPSGPRGGVDEAGDDVGQFTSLTVDAEGHLHVAYFDVTHRQLKYAHGALQEDGAIQWNVMMLDDGRVETDTERTPDAGAGWWTDITLDALGRPHVIYRAQYQAEDEGGAVTEVRLISAGDAAPTARAAWGTPRSLDRVIPTASLMSLGYPEGTGLFNNLVRTQNGLAAAWYDRSGGQMMFASSEGSEWMQPQVVAGWSHESLRGDYGANVNLAIGPEGNTHFCYQDGATDSLRYLSPDLDRDEWVDDGVRLGVGGREHALHVVGEDCRITFDARGRALITYQDATGHELLVARRDAGGNWLRLTVRGPQLNESRSASGFYARGIVIQSEVMISHYVYDHQVEPPRQRLEVLWIPSP